MAELEYLRLDDFSPGIRDKHSPGQQPGVAQRTHTYGCVSIEGSGLEPLPKPQVVRTAKQLNRVGGTDYALDSVSGWHYNGDDLMSDANFEVCGFFSQGGIGGAADSYDYPVELYVGVQWIEHDGASAYRRNVRVEAVNLTNDLNYELLDRAVTTGPTPISSDLWRPITFASTRENRSSTWAIDDQYRPGDPVVVVSWMSHDLSDWDVIEYPDAEDGSGTPKYLMSDATSVGSPTTNLPVEIMSHQNRLIGFVNQEFTRSNGPDITSNENMAFSTPAGVLFDYESSGANTFGEQIAFEIQNATGYTAWASMSSSQLLLIKGRGAVVVQGSLEHPTVIALPKMVGNATALGAMAGIGYVYPVAKGHAYVWQGEESATNISPNMNPGFLDYDDASKRKGLTGECAAWNHFVLAPNDWLFDERSAAWWRINDPVSGTFENRIRYWNVPAGQVFDNTDAAYGAVGKYGEQGEAVICRLESDVLASEFSWRSHALNLNPRKVAQIREVGVSFTGRGSVHVEIFKGGSEDDGPELSAVFDKTASGNENVTHILRETTGLDCTAFSVRIRSFSHDGSSAAPTVHNVNLGYNTKHHIGNSSDSHRGVLLDRDDDKLDDGKLG